MPVRLPNLSSWQQDLNLGVAIKFGAKGIGLLRTEVLFINRSQPPNEQTQNFAYRTIMELMGDRRIVVRTLDIGRDKEISILILKRKLIWFLITVPLAAHRISA